MATDCGEFQEYYICRVDAPPGVEVPGGSYVTVESGPHHGLQQALSLLLNPKPRAHVLPDIIFLPLGTTVYALNQAVPLKPRMVVAAVEVQRARDASRAGASARAAAATPVATPGRRAGPAGAHDSADVDRPAPSTQRRIMHAAAPSLGDAAPQLASPALPAALVQMQQWQLLQQAALQMQPAAGPAFWPLMQAAAGALQQQQQQPAPDSPEQRPASEAHTSVPLQQQVLDGSPEQQEEPHQQEQAALHELAGAAAAAAHVAAGQEVLGETTGCHTPARPVAAAGRTSAAPTTEPRPGRQAAGCGSHEGESEDEGSPDARDKG